MFYMSGEHITNTSIQRDSENNQRDLKSRIKRKVDINVLLNRVRTDKKRERFENIIFVSLLSAVILVSGIIISL